MQLVDQIDFRHKLTKQFPIASLRVAYSASAMYIAAAILEDSEAIVSHGLYWASVESVEEARYLVAILNSTALTAAVKPLQAQGENNPRHVDKYVWRLPIPVYDRREATHVELVALAGRAEIVAKNVALPQVRFEAKRRLIRRALERDGVAAEIDTIVKRLLSRGIDAM